MTTRFRTKAKPVASVTAAGYVVNTANASTAIRVTWPAAPDSGSPVASYVLYRDGVYLATIQRPSGAYPTYTYLDANATTVASHTYSVAVVTVGGATSPERGSNAAQRPTAPYWLGTAPTTLTLGAGATYQFASHADSYDADDTFTYSIITNPGGYSINSSTGLLTVGTASGSLTVRVTDQTGLYADTTCTMTVSNNPPVWSGSTALGTYSNAQVNNIPLAGYASDPDSDALTFALTYSDLVGATASVNSSSGVLTIPSGATAGSYNFVVTVTDGKSTPISRTFSATMQAVSSSLLFFDDFDYALERVQPSATKISIMRAQGYSDFKDENVSTNSNVYIYTQTSVPGYVGTLPGTGPRALTFEAFDALTQRSYYLMLGNGADAATSAEASVPSDVWFQFWMYLAPDIAPSGKWFYPLPAAPGTRTGYPGSVQEMPWLNTVSYQTFEPSGSLTSAPVAGWYTFNTEIYNATDPPTVGHTDWPSANRWKLGPNLRSGDDRWLRPGVWYLHRMHFNTVGTGGTWEWWARQMGVPSFTKWAEYIHGTTANFAWETTATHRNGFRYLGFPVTNSTSSVQHLRDFAIASAESALPNYGSY